MQKILIEGGCELSGVIKISGAKNAALPVMAAAILTDIPCHIDNIPELRDVDGFAELLSSLGAKVSLKEHSADIDCSSVKSVTAYYDLVKKMRASILVLGPLLARFGSAKVSLPGGCAIGVRPINFHIDALKKMGAVGALENGYINMLAPHGLHGANIFFPKVTVTGTENILMAASLAKGKTVIYNAAKEPEIINLANALKKMGAHITGIGSSEISVERESLSNGFNETIMPDRIETGTFISAVGASKGDVVLEGADINLLSYPIDIYRSIGINVKRCAGGISVSCSKKLKSVSILTAAYPGFPTDLQAQIMADLSLADGVSFIDENIFENRFMHAAELSRMGADIKIDGNHAIIRGADYLYGANVMATDLRASASLVIAGLAAVGVTKIDRAYHIDRGYEKIEKKLRAVGAKIWREN